MPKLTNPAVDDVRLVSGRTIAAGETVDVTDEEYRTAGPLFIRESSDVPERKAVRRGGKVAEVTTGPTVEER